MNKRVLVGCEESQTITIAMRKIGIEAFSCDIIDCSGSHPEWHIEDDVLNHLNDGWDLFIVHPPCTYFSIVGNKWFNVEKYKEKAIERYKLREQALEFVKKLWNAPINKICLENPVGYLNTHFLKPTQIIQPYWFGDKESKRTCLWLKNLPPLKPTNIVKPTVYGYKKNGDPLYFTEYKTGNKTRSKTFPGIAEAMAEQWGKIL